MGHKQIIQAGLKECFINNTGPFTENLPLLNLLIGSLSAINLIL